MLGEDETVAAEMLFIPLWAPTFSALREPRFQCMPLLRAAHSSSNSPFVIQVLEKEFQVVLCAKNCARDEDRMYIHMKLDEFLGRRDIDVNRAAFLQSCAVKEVCLCLPYGLLAAGPQPDIWIHTIGKVCTLCTLIACALSQPPSALKAIRKSSDQRSP